MHAFAERAGTDIAERAGTDIAERAGTDIFAVVGLSGGWRDLPERLLAELMAGRAELRHRR
jgi:hypothetical protein